MHACHAMLPIIRLSVSVVCLSSPFLPICPILSKPFIYSLSGQSNDLCTVHGARSPRQTSTSCRHQTKMFGVDDSGRLLSCLFSLDVLVRLLDTLCPNLRCGCRPFSSCYYRYAEHTNAHTCGSCGKHFYEVLYSLRSEELTVESDSRHGPHHWAPPFAKDMPLV